MIDVAKFRVSDRCPRCDNRRVLAVDLDRNLWLCAPSAMPIPWRHDQVLEHEAAEEPNEFTIALLRTIEHNQAKQVINER